MSASGLRASRNLTFFGTKFRAPRAVDACSTGARGAISVKVLENEVKLPTEGTRYVQALLLTATAYPKYQSTQSTFSAGHTFYPR